MQYVNSNKEFNKWYLFQNFIQIKAYFERIVLTFKTNLNIILQLIGSILFNVWSCVGVSIAIFRLNVIMVLVIFSAQMRSLTERFQPRSRSTMMDHVSGYHRACSSPHVVQVRTIKYVNKDIPLEIVTVVYSDKCCLTRSNQAVVIAILNTCIYVNQ